MTKPKRSAWVRSKLTNGNALFLGDADGRSEIGRLFADTIADLIAERGGREALTVGQLSAIRNYAGHLIMQEQMLADMAQGKPVEADTYARIGDRMARQMRMMGPVKPAAKRNLDDWISDKRTKRA